MICLTEQEFHKIEKFVRDNFGINLEKKFALIQARLSLDIERRGYSSFEEYYQTVASNPHGQECQHMVDKLSTNHTFFFREPVSFDHMSQVALPELIKKGVDEIRVWSAAASTGQEIYSIAMVLDEALSLYGKADFVLTGSDINEEALATAENGIYPIAELARIPQKFRQRYCVKHSNGTFEIAPFLRKHVSFHLKNLVRPFGVMQKMHFVYCRNVMIYFKADVKQKLTEELNRVILTGGYLYIGSTETIDPAKRFFKYIKPSVFAKVGGAA